MLIPPRLKQGRAFFFIGSIGFQMAFGLKTVTLSGNTDPHAVAVETLQRCPEHQLELWFSDGITLSHLLRIYRNHQNKDCQSKRALAQTK